MSAKRILSGQLRLVPAPASQQSTELRQREEDDFSDRKNASMKCPVNKTELEHVTILFRARQGVNAGKLFWKCMDCNDQRGVKGKLIGQDSELESDGMKTIDASRVDSSSKRHKIAEEAIIASGRGVNWSQLASDVSTIRDSVERLAKYFERAEERTRRSEQVLHSLSDILSKGGGSAEQLADLTTFVQNVAADISRNSEDE